MEIRHLNPSMTVNTSLEEGGDKRAPDRSVENTAYVTAMEWVEQCEVRHEVMRKRCAKTLWEVTVAYLNTQHLLARLGWQSQN